MELLYANEYQYLTVQYSNKPGEYIGDYAIMSFSYRHHTDHLRLESRSTMSRQPTLHNKANQQSKYKTSSLVNNEISGKET